MVNESEPTWHVGSSEELYDVANFLPTREHALEEAADFGDDCWICRAKLEEWFPPSAELALEEWLILADENLFHPDMPMDIDTNPLLASLQTALNQWFESIKHTLPQPTMFCSVTDKEFVYAALD
jgi:hypothetical protein